jgi:hypothetical protein
MLTLETMFVLAMQQRYGVTGLEVTTHPKHVYSHLDEHRQLIKVARPVLRFDVGRITIEKPMPMALKAEWIEGSAGVAMQRVFAECEWNALDVENYIRQAVADLSDNLLVKGAS